MVVLTFYSTYFALTAEKVVRAAGLSGKLIPVPRQISTSCGTALRLEEAEVDTALQLLHGAGVEVSGVHHLP
ncbi:MAG: DUF3343 domain-containing protein [Firmicutes bacterium]|nr:DUF3343 domain-containing protein [Bacillota bacterium]